MIILITLFMILLLAEYNYLIIAWGEAFFDENKQYYSKLWHRIGGLIRFILIILVSTYILSEINYNTVYLIVGLCLLNWVIYDIWLNLRRGLSLFYRGSVASGSGSFIDKLFSNDFIYYICKIIALIGGIILISL